MPDNVIRIDVCTCQTDYHKKTKTSEPCCGKCPFCGENIRLQFFVNHVGRCKRPEQPRPAA